jgi:hypothetical protein
MHTGSCLCSSKITLKACDKYKMAHFTAANAVSMPEKISYHNEGNSKEAFSNHFQK